MRKLVVITAALTALSLSPVASAQTPNQAPTTNTQPKATPSTPRATTTTVPKATKATAKVKANRTARKGTSTLRHARNHRNMGMYGYRSAGKRQVLRAKVGYRATHRRHHRVMGYRAGSVGCR